MALPSGDWELPWGSWAPPVLENSWVPMSTRAKSPRRYHPSEAQTLHIHVKSLNCFWAHTTQS